MNRDTLLQRLKELSLPKEEYWVVAGGAMVLHGFRNETYDIDLGCSTFLADKLEKQGYIISYCEDGNRRIKYSNDVELFENWIEGEVELVSGIPVISIDGLVQMKRKLGREKDLTDILLIEAKR